MIRVLFLIVVCTVYAHAVHAQPRIKGKRSDTTIGILADDTTVKKLIEFKDSVTQVRPATEGLRELEESDSTGMVLLIVGSVLLIAWAGRRAWLRQRRS